MYINTFTYMYIYVIRPAKIDHTVDSPIFKPGAHGCRPHVPGFLKFLWLTYQYVCVCVSVCVSAPRALITSGAIWCDIGLVQLVKQVLRLFPAFNYFI